MGKSIFQVLEEVRVDDKVNNTDSITVSTGLKTFNETKKEVRLTFGLPIGSVGGMDIMKGRKKLLVIVVDSEAYDKHCE